MSLHSLSLEVDAESFEPDGIDRVILPSVNDLLLALVVASDKPSAAATRVATLALVLSQAAELAAQDASEADRG